MAGRGNQSGVCIPVTPAYHLHMKLALHNAQLAAEFMREILEG